VGQGGTTTGPTSGEDAPRSGARDGGLIPTRGVARGILAHPPGCDRLIPRSRWSLPVCPRATTGCQSTSCGVKRGVVLGTYVTSPQAILASRTDPRTANEWDYFLLALNNFVDNKQILGYMACTHAHIRELVMRTESQHGVSLCHDKADMSRVQRRAEAMHVWTDELQA
jgi:hypothetical protein